jgi:hypothetical protein
MRWIDQPAGARSRAAMGWPCLVVACLLVSAPFARAQTKTQNLILITLDGARIQEMFGGLDLEILTSTLGKKTLEDSPVYRRFWAETPEARRVKLMPFFWGTLMTQHGSIAGNRARGSAVQLTNTHRFSYPGYSEILTGEARDAVINSNDPRRNPFPTVLEFIKTALKLDTAKVAVFASWDVAPFIVAHKEGEIAANAGYQAYDHSDPLIQRLSLAQYETLTPWDGVRHDYFTFRFAMAHLAASRPRVLLLMLGQPDDWSHDERYDRVLQSYALFDGYMKELWTWLQSQEDYRDRTTILLTTDHGRGNTPKDWGSHGAKIEGAQYTWLAAIGPDFAKRGEWKNATTIYTNQIAATMARVLGLDFNRTYPSAGKPVDFGVPGR